MCLQFNKEDKRIATKHILCSKEGKVKNTGFFPHYRDDGFFYKRGVLAEWVNIKVQQWSNHKSISEGYHSWRNIFSLGTGWHLFIIPKGTTYYVGGFNSPNRKNNYCSEQIVWIGHKLNPLSWIKAKNWKPKSK
jgi:hypothetical protein